ncbi:MAG: hypothetical protein ACLP6G_08495 [Terriglobales bacterium]
MHSSLDSDGFRLLNKWKTNAAEVRVSFVGIGNKLLISGSAAIVELDSAVLRLSGAAFEVFIDLSGAAFGNVLTEETFRLNFDPRYTESAELLLSSGDKVAFFGTPCALESGGVN